MIEIIKEYKVEIIQTIVIIIIYMTVRITIKKMTNSVASKFVYQKPRVKIIQKIINLFLTFVALGILFFIWGVKQSELAYFISSLITILGIAFFAQWSIISNITSTLIIFFNHPAKIGDTITVLDKENPVEGVISDIGAFFVIIKTEEGEKVTLPSNVFIQKMIKKKGLD